MSTRLASRNCASGSAYLGAAACPFERIHGDGYPVFFIDDTGIICVACDPFDQWSMGFEDFADIGARDAVAFGVILQHLIAHTATHGNPLSSAIQKVMRRKTRQII
jgi:hypothetical protein